MTYIAAWVVIGAATGFVLEGELADSRAQQVRCYLLGILAWPLVVAALLIKILFRAAVEL